MAAKVVDCEPEGGERRGAMNRALIVNGLGKTKVYLFELLLKGEQAVAPIKFDNNLVLYRING